MIGALTVYNVAEPRKPRTGLKQTPRRAQVVRPREGRRTQKTQDGIETVLASGRRGPPSRRRRTQKTQDRIETLIVKRSPPRGPSRRTQKTQDGIETGLADEFGATLAQSQNPENPGRD